MSDPKPVLDDINPEEWKRNLEYSLRHEFSNCPLEEKTKFVKKMADGLKLTLDDVRGKNDSAKYKALNSIPPDVIPFEINLADGHRIILMMVNPVATCYEDFLTDVRGDIVHIYVRRKGEELPEDFLPPRIIMNVSPPPPGFVRSSVFRRRVVTPSVDRNDAAEQRPCQSEQRPGTSEPGPSASEPMPSTSKLGPITSVPGPSTSVPGPSTSVSGPSTSVPGPSTIILESSKSVTGVSTSDTPKLGTISSELGPIASEPGPSSVESRPSTGKELVVLAKKDGNYKEESTFGFGITNDRHSLTDEIVMEEVVHNVTVEYISTDMDREFEEECIPSINQGYTQTSVPETSTPELDPVASQPGPSSSEEIVTLMDEKYKEESRYDITEDKYALTDDILVEEVAHNVVIEYNSTDKHQEESMSDERKEETIWDNNQDQSVSIISYGEETSDEEHQKESIVDSSEEDNEDTPDSKENDSSYDEKDLDESIPSTIDVSLPSTSDDLSDTKSIDLELYPCIEIDSTNSNSTTFSSKIQVVGLIDPDNINEVEPEVELQTEESSHVEKSDVIFVPQDKEDMPSTSSPVIRKRGRPRKYNKDIVEHNTRTQDHVDTSLRQIKTRFSSRCNSGKTSGKGSVKSKKTTSSLINKELMALAQNFEESCNASPRRKKKNSGATRKIKKP